MPSTFATLDLTNSRRDASFLKDHRLALSFTGFRLKYGALFEREIGFREKAMCNFHPTERIDPGVSSSFQAMVRTGPSPIDIMTCLDMVLDHAPWQAEFLEDRKLRWSGPCPSISLLRAYMSVPSKRHN